jgi:hypothetical protein
MIEFEEKLDGVNSNVNKAVRMFWMNMNPNTIQIIAGKCTDEQAKCIIALGGTLKEVNEARSYCGLYPIAMKMNRKIAKPKYGEILKKGDGALFVVRSNGFRHKINPKIKTILDFVVENVPGIAYDVVNNERHDTFFFYVKKKKGESLDEQPIEEQPENNEGA